jgi:biopolymer transport protein ExbD
MNKKITSFSALCLIVVFLVAACSPAKSNTVAIPNVQNGSKSTATPAAGAYPAAIAPLPQTGYPAAIAAPLKVVKTDGTSISLNAATLSNIPTNTVKAGSDSINGISVTSILSSAGIGDYKQITFVGASGSQSLTKDKVNGSVILKISEDGTLQLVSPDLPQDNWVKAVNTIKAE